MDIEILDSWLKEFLNTKAKATEIAKYLSLCGPSVERVTKIENDSVYDIEVTTNRIDSASVYGIAREAQAILPRFGVKAKLKPIRYESKDFTFTRKVKYLTAEVDAKLCPRFTAVLIKNVKIGKSPDIIQKRLELSGIRSINNIVDISNYIMLELGQPVHTFDYDKIAGAKMILRESKKDEKIQTLDGNKFTLPGGDIVIEDATGKLIDLAGIMGGYVSAIDENTKNVLLFVQTYNPVNIRKTSMNLAQRTIASSLFEKGTDTELVAPAMLEAIKLFKKMTGGDVSAEILDIYPRPYKTLTAKISSDYITQRLGVEIPKKEVTGYLTSLGFGCKWTGNVLTAEIPSNRSKDVKSSEDLLEEIARIYGYHNLPGTLMNGEIPGRPIDPKFALETKIKNIISGFGGVEVYTLSLVPGSFVNERHLELKNPLGPETVALRTSLMPSLISAAKENIGTESDFHLFEMANVYLPVNDNLPEERSMLAGILSGYSYRKAKGIVEALLERLNINASFSSEETKGFAAGKCALIYKGREELGKIGIIENTDLIYYEFSVQKLIENSPKIIAFTSIPKYPPQIEDITFSLPEKTRVGEVISSIVSISKLITQVDLKDIYRDSYTFRVFYQDRQKTLTDIDVEKIRKEVTTLLKNKFGASVKE